MHYTNNANIKQIKKNEDEDCEFFTRKKFLKFNLIKRIEQYFPFLTGFNRIN